MNKSTTAIPIIDFPHFNAFLVLIRPNRRPVYTPLLPFLERLVTCPDKGGSGNTPLDDCQMCPRYRGMGKSTARESLILCQINKQELIKKPERNSKEVKL